jgi:hypothetical protein
LSMIWTNVNIPSPSSKSPPTACKVLRTVIVTRDLCEPVMLSCRGGRGTSLGRARAQVMSKEAGDGRERKRWKEGA